jgi:hypothetical protein
MGEIPEQVKRDRATRAWMTANKPCQCCGRRIKNLPGLSKARYAHKCPHGVRCPAGGRLSGQHRNGPLQPKLGGCPKCYETYGLKKWRDG